MVDWCELAYEDRVRRSADQLFQEAGIAYSVLGAIARRMHGLVRMTWTSTFLLTPEGLAEFQARCVFRAAETGVRIEVLTSGSRGRPEQR